jgi:hypothetical protein
MQVDLPELTARVGADDGQTGKLLAHGENHDGQSSAL